MCLFFGCILVCVCVCLYVLVCVWHIISVIVFIHYLPQYEDGEQSVADLAALLVSMLDTPEKLHLLTEVR